MEVLIITLLDLTLCSDPIVEILRDFSWPPFFFFFLTEENVHRSFPS